jgi:hypothetical protein
MDTFNQLVELINKHPHAIKYFDENQKNIITKCGTAYLSDIIDRNKSVELQSQVLINLLEYTNLHTRESNYGINYGIYLLESALLGDFTVDAIKKVVEKLKKKESIQLQSVDISTMFSFDAVTFNESGDTVEKSVSKHLFEGVNNLFFKFDDERSFLTSKKSIVQKFKNHDKEFISINFPCMVADSLNPININHSVPLFNLKMIYPFIGDTYIELKRLTTILDQTSRQCYKIVSKNPPQKVESVVSLSVLNGGTHVSANHCQKLKLGTRINPETNESENTYTHAEIMDIVPLHTTVVKTTTQDKQNNVQPVANIRRTKRKLNQNS